MDWVDLLVGLAGGLVLVYAVLLAGLWWYARRHPEAVGMRDSLRLLPDLLRLLRRLAGDRAVPARVRLLLVLLLAYLASPLDLVPDFLPVIGYADDVLVVAWGLRLLIRTAGPEALRRHWPCTPAGLRVIERLAGLPTSCPGPAERPRKP